MSVNQKHSKIKFDHLRIDYVSLFKFWKELTLYQTEILAFESSPHHPRERLVKTESIKTVKSKLTSSQKELVKTNFLRKLKKKNYSSAANKKVLLSLQDQLESGLIKSVEEFESNASLRKAARQKKGIKSFKVSLNGETKSYDMFDVPEKISKWRAWKLVQDHQSAKCFYTGEECVISTNPKKWKVTEEHLIPQVTGGKRENGNNVVAANWVNNILGGAPLHVKVDVMQALNKISCHPILTLRQRSKVYKVVINQVLDRYKVYRRLPWNEPSKKNSKEARTINKVYELHRQAEKKFIDSILGRSSNIANTLREIANGMDTPFYEIL